MLSWDLIKIYLIEQNYLKPPTIISEERLEDMRNNTSLADRLIFSRKNVKLIVQVETLLDAEAWRERKGMVEYHDELEFFCRRWTLEMAARRAGQSL